MRCLVIGCGSIGSRRARVLKEMGHEVGCNDVDTQRAATVAEEIGATAINDMAWARAPVPGKAWPADAAFICTPPETHLDLACQCEEAGIRGLFVEKPLTLTKSEVGAFLGHFEGEPQLVTMGACNMRFDEGVALARDKMLGAPWYSARMGQHEDHWSPTHQNQTMILDDIHELDLLRYVAGPIEEIHGGSDTQSAFGYTVHENGARGIFTLDRWTDPPVRELTAFYDDDHPTVRVNLWPPDLAMYRREMEHFLDCVERGVPTCNPLAQAAETLKWALEVVG